MTNELLQLGLQLNVLCLAQLKQIVILKPKPSTVALETGTQNSNKQSGAVSIRPNSYLHLEGGYV